jgi:fibronectin-binding autotransporter adhesin
MQGFSKSLSAGSKANRASGRKRARNLLAIAAAGALGGVLTHRAGAAIDTWAGSAGSTDWITAANWSDGTSAAPVSTDSLLFSGDAFSSTLTDTLTNSSFNVAGITFAAFSPAYTFNGNAFALTGGITNNAGTVKTINNAVGLANTQTVTATSPGGISLGGLISGAGGITATGGGTLTLSAANTFSGQLTINGGVVSVTSVAASGSAQGAGENSTVALNGGTFRITQPTVSFNLAFNIGASGGTLDAAGVYSGSGNYVIYSGSLTGSGTVTFLDSTTGGTGTASNDWLFTGNSSSFTGNVVIGNGQTNSGWVQYRSNSLEVFGGNGTAGSGGTVTINAGGILSSDTGNGTPVAVTNPIILNGGFLGTQGATLTYSGPITLNASTTSTVGWANNTESAPLTLSGVITGSGALKVSDAAGGTGTNTVTFTNANTFSGSTTPTLGTLDVKNSLALQNSQLVTGSGGTIAFDSAASGSSTAFTLGGLSGNGNLALQNTAGAVAADAIALTVGNNAGNGSTPASSSYSGVLSGYGSLIKTGTGTQTLSGANTFTGATTVNSGTLVVSKTSTGSAVSANGGTLEVDYTGGATGSILDPTKVLTLNGGTFNVNGNATVSDTQTFASLTAGGGTLSVTNNGASATGLTFTSGTITRTAGGTANFVSPSGTSITLTGNAGNQFIGLWAFFNGTNYAATNASGVVVGAAAGTAVTGVDNFTSATANYAYTSAGTPDALSGTATAATANTAIFNTGSAQVIDLGTAASNTNTLTMNGFINDGAALTIQHSVGTGNFIIGANKELDIGGTGNVTITVPIADNSAGASILSTADTGNLTLTSASTYSGATAVNAGTLQLGDGTSGHDGSLTTSGITDNGTVVYNLFGAQSVTYPITGSGALTKSGTAALVLTGLNSYGGGTTVSGGTLQIGNGTVNGTIGTGTYNIISGARLCLDYNNIPTGVGTAQNFFTISGAGTLELNTASAGGDWAAGSGQNYVAFGTGFTGTIVLDKGRLPTNGTGTLGNATAFVVVSGSQFASWQGGTFPQNFTIAGAYGQEALEPEALRMANTGNTTNFTGTIALSASATIAAAGTANISGIISGAAGSNLQIGGDGAGLVVLTGVNTYLGSTTISNSNGNETLQLGNGTSGNDGSLSTSGITDNAILTYNLFGPQTASYPINGTGVLNKTGAGTLVLNASNSYSGGTKISAGTLLANSTNSTSGSTGSGLVTVANGGILGGGAGTTQGYVVGAITVNSGGTLTAGAGVASATAAAAPGILNANSGTVTLASGSNLDVKVNSVSNTAVVGTNWDEVVINALSVSSLSSSAPANINLYGLTAANVVGPTPTPGFSSTTPFTLTNVVVFPNVTQTALAADINAGDFALNTSNFTNNNTTPYANIGFELLAVTDGGGSALDVEYTATPEPGTALLVLAGAMPMLGARRRRRKVS